MPSRQFAKIWDAIEDLRKKKGLSEEEAAEAHGFVRSTWFNYKAHGGIPFGLLERVVQGLGGMVQAAVIAGSSDRTGTSVAPSSSEESDVSDESHRIARMLDELPDLRKQRLINMFEGMIALERVNASHPLDADAEQPGPRARSNKS